MWDRFILLCFLLILLVSMMCSLSNRFICYFFRLLKFTLGKSRLHIVYISDSIQQEILPVSLKLVEYAFDHQIYPWKNVHCETSKQTVDASQDWYKISLCWNNLFRDKQIICLRQADCMRRSSLLVKVQV